MSQAQKNVEACLQKLRLLKMSLENRIEEYPMIAKALQGVEPNGETIATPTTLPRPAQLTGTFYLKLLGVEGLLDLYHLHMADLDLNSSASSIPPRTYSAGHVVKNNSRNFMTLPNPHQREREKEREKDRERTGTATDDDGGVVNTWYKRGSKHVRFKNAALQKQHSLEHIDDCSSKCQGIM